MNSKAFTFPLSDHYDGSTFFNTSGSTTKKGLLSVLKWKLQSSPSQWPKNVENKFVPQVDKKLSDKEVAVTFINHASFLIQSQNFNILTDPQFSDRASPFSWVGPKRVRPPALPIAKLPQIHMVLVSHNHYDHLDLPSLKEISQKFNPHFMVPLGDAALLKSQGIEKIYEMDWWTQAEIIQGLKITMVPAQHWSARSLFDRNKSLWGGYFIYFSNKRPIYFAGDSGYGDHFKKIKEKLGSPQLSLIPIGAYEPRWFMKEQHVNPQEAVQAHIDLASKKSIGMHFGTFQLTDEAIDAPVTALREARKEKNIPENDFIAPEIGESFLFTLE